MSDWERFSHRLPSDIDLKYWYEYPDAGIGLLTGKFSRIVALDRDYDTNGTDALDRLIPYTPVKKKGAKGYTAFFRYNGEKSCSFNIGGARVLDVLSDGRQTLMPGTIHPDGHTYIYLTEDLLEEYDPQDLPALPDDFLEQVAKILEPYQNEADKKYQKKTLALPSGTDEINTELSIQGQYFAQMNSIALQNLDKWVPKLVITAKPEREGFRCIATWRGVKNPNVGIHPTGIYDFGGGYGMTPIDLVMNANNIPFIKAAEALGKLIPMPEVTPILFGASAPASPPGQEPPPQLGQPTETPGVFIPWLKPAVPDTPVMLPPTTSVEPAPAVPRFVTSPPGILDDIAHWITETAPKQQPELSLAAAIALASVVMGRTYRSQYGNYTTLYLVMVGKSTEGKEYPQACVSKALVESNLEDLIGGSGYTSAGAVFSALIKSPVHITLVDEMGKLLKLSRASGQSNTEAALDKLVEAFGRCDGVMRPPTYSTMTLSKTQLSSTPMGQVVHNPAVTLLGATTPSTFYGALTADLIQDGFLGRCIVVESKQPRQLTRFVPRDGKVPQKIIDWIRATHVTGVVEGNLVDHQTSGAPPITVELPFSESCLAMMRGLELELNEEKKAAETDGFDVLLGRTLEKAMRLAMIACKAENPLNREVLPHHLDWAIQYVRHYDLLMIKTTREERKISEVDETIKKIIKFLKNVRTYKGDANYGKICAKGYMPYGKLLRLMKISTRQLKEILETAGESNQILSLDGDSIGAGVTKVYFLDGEVDAQ